MAVKVGREAEQRRSPASEGLITPPSGINFHANSGLNVAVKSASKTRPPGSIQLPPYDSRGTTPRRAPFPLPPPPFEPFRYHFHGYRTSRFPFVFIRIHVKYENCRLVSRLRFEAIPLLFNRISRFATKFEWLITPSLVLDRGAWPAQRFPVGKRKVGSLRGDALSRVWRATTVPSASV